MAEWIATESSADRGYPSPGATNNRRAICVLVRIACALTSYFEPWQTGDCSLGVLVYPHSGL